MSIKKHVTLQKIIAHDFRYVSRNMLSSLLFYLDLIVGVLPELPTSLGQMVLIHFVFRTINAAGVREYLS